MNALALIGSNGGGLDGSSLSQNIHGGGLKVLFISLTREDQVDFILRKLPRLEFLNGLAVDREELYSSQGDDDRVKQNEEDDEEEDEEDSNKDRHESNANDESVGLQGRDSSLVQVMEGKHEMFGIRPSGGSSHLD